MNVKTLMACTAMMTCLSGTSLMAHAQNTSTQSVQAEHTNEQYKVGDTAHDLYKEERVGIKDWKDKGLSAPQKDSQWVQISDKYVLVQLDSGKILAISPIKTQPLKQ